MDVRFREKFQDALAVVVSDEDRAGLDILTHGDYHCDEDLAGRAWHHYPVPEPVRIATRAGRVIVDGQHPVGNVQPACGLRTGGPRRPIRVAPDEARRCPGARGTSHGTCVGTGTWKVSWGQPLTKSPGRARSAGRGVPGSRRHEGTRAGDASLDADRRRPARYRRIQWREEVSR